MDAIGTRSRVDLTGIISPDARLQVPGIVDLVEQDAAIQDSFVRDALDDLGRPGRPPLDAWAEQRRATTLGIAVSSGRPLDLDAVALLERNRHAIPVPVGTGVVLPERPLDTEPWFVAGAGRSDRLEVARRLPDGTLQRQTRRWSEMVLANPSLAEQHLIPRGSSTLLPMFLRERLPAGDASASAVDAFEATRAATPPAVRGYELVSTAPLNGGPLVLSQGTWEELAARQGLTRLRPLPVMPSDGATAASVAYLAADPGLGRVVMAAEAQQLLGRPLLVGTDQLVPGHRATADAVELERISTFYDGLGLRTWRDPGVGLLLTTGDFDSIGDASAHGNADFAMVTTGPRDARTTASVSRTLPYDAGSAMRMSDGTLRAHWPAVLGHEVGHVATQQAWGLDVGARSSAARNAGDAAAYAALAEHGVAEEAFSDLFGASYARSRDLGLRDLGRLRNGIGDLDQLRATIVARGLDYTGHTGTQLITKPMLLLQQRHGWAAVADVTAAATSQLGAGLGRGDIDAIDITTAARALRDAAAMRWGADDDLVRGMTAAWTKLRVLV